MKIRSLMIGTMLVASSMTTTYAGLNIANIAEDNSVSLTLNMDEKRFAVTGGCNTIMGGFEIDQFDEFMAARNLASTMMACNESLEKMSTRIQAFLENQPKLVRQKNDLFLVGTIAEETASVYMPVVLDQGQYKDVKAEVYERIFIYVSNEKVPCPTNPEAKCLQIRTEKNEAWQPFEGTIEGFSPQEGLAYRLRLKEYNKGTENQRWVYDMAVEQELIQ